MPGAFITGEALYATLLSANPDLAYTWHDLNTYDKDVYVEVATVLNGTYLAPLQGSVDLLLRNTSITHDCALAERQIEQQCEQVRALQGLVMQWRQLLQEHDELSVMSLTEIEDWNTHWELLKRRSRELLGEEQQKEG